ncbi:mevalonate kinase [Microbacterium sp.]|uniref:mevalonate kinase n=1 Tax=Microbacterium sp. TaxID=51671 RepID=UPI0039E6FB9F
MNTITSALERPVPSAGTPAADDPAAGLAVGTGRAQAKAILFGEHSVVYGAPALAVPVAALPAEAEASFAADGVDRLYSALYNGRLDRAPERTLPTVTAITAARAAVGATAGTTTGAAQRPLQVRVRSRIPAERGLGSSAAVAAAIVDAVAALTGVTLTGGERHDAVQTAERAAHGTPSGLDARAVRAAGPIRFQDGAAVPLLVAAPLHLVIADSGVRGRTREAVQGVRERREADRDGIDRIVGALGELCDLAVDALAEGDTATVGAAMTEAHALLNALGVGDPALDHLVSVAAAHEALGAKLTGGGRGGCALILAADADHAATLSGALHEAGAAAVWTTMVAATDPRGEAPAR